MSVRFTASIDDMVNWLKKTMGSDLSYHRNRSELYSDFVKIVTYSHPTKDVVLSFRQFAAIKQRLTAKDDKDLFQEALLLFDVVLGELWEAADKVAVPEAEPVSTIGKIPGGQPLDAKKVEQQYKIQLSSARDAIEQEKRKNLDLLRQLEEVHAHLEEQALQKQTR